MRVAIKDANIIFDLHEMDLLETFLDLDYEFITSDFVKSEIKNEGLLKQINSFIRNNLLRIERLDYDLIIEAVKLQHEQTGLSIPDCSVLILAMKYNGIILSGDRLLRNKSKEIGIEYHGILWVLDKLIEHRKIDSKNASEKLKYLMKINDRLPITECKKRLELWA